MCRFRVMKLYLYFFRKCKCIGFERINKNIKMIVGFEINIFLLYILVYF